MRQAMSHYFFSLFISCVYLFLYVPIIVLVLFSFNDNEFTFSWTRLTTRWYSELFSSVEVWVALKNSLLVAGSAVTLSLGMAFFLVFYASDKYRKRIPLFFSANLAMPEIVLAIGMLAFFSFFSIPLGLPTLIVGHTLIGLGYVVPIVYDRYRDVSRRYAEASLDLGATMTQTMYRVMLPMIRPSLIAAGLLVFIVSFDDFIIAFFCAGASAQTLPLFIFSLIRTGASPVVSALSVLLLGASSLLVLIFSSFQVKKMVLPK